jgi:hypothetical protein
MSSKDVWLEPKYFLDDNWKVIQQIPDIVAAEPEEAEVGIASNGLGQMEQWEADEGGLGTEEEKWIGEIRQIRIEVAEAAETRKISSGKKYDYFKSEIGMNIILPRGSIKELRFFVALIPTDKVVAIDGFPRDIIEEKDIAGGTIQVGISKAFKFIPVAGPLLSELINIEFNPWKFSLGSLKRVNVDFSGGLTPNPEWYFKKDGIKNDLRVALTLRKPKGVKGINALVSAKWKYDPGLFKEKTFGTDSENIVIY